MENRINALRSFLDASHSMYHAQDYLVKTLKEAGYVRLMENESWQLVPGGKYYISRGGVAVIAFRIPGETPGGFMMSARRWTFSNVGKRSYKMYAIYSANVNC